MSTTIPSSPAASEHGGAPTDARATPTPVAPTTLSVPALMGELPVIRMLTEVVAMHGGCTLDQVSDLKLAVDQICTLLIEVAVPATEITCRFHTGSDVLRVEVTATTTGPWGPAPDSLEWRILEVLADTIAASEVVAPNGQTTEARVELSIGMPA